MEKKKVILAVDDMLLNLRTIEVLLGACFDVRKAKSGEIALKLLSTNHVDLILLDIEMPGMSGFDFLEVVKSSPDTANIPVMFLTSRASSEFVLRAKREGAVDYIMKPFLSGVLEQKVCKVLGATDVYVSPDGRLLPMPGHLAKPKKSAPAPTRTPVDVPDDFSGDDLDMPDMAMDTDTSVDADTDMDLNIDTNMNMDFNIDEDTPS